MAETDYILWWCRAAIPRTQALLEATLLSTLPEGLTAVRRADIT